MVAIIRRCGRGSDGAGADTASSIDDVDSELLATLDDNQMLQVVRVLQHICAKAAPSFARGDDSHDDTIVAVSQEMCDSMNDASNIDKHSIERAVATLQALNVVALDDSTTPDDSEIKVRLSQI
jgi:hypothetical protein